MLSGWIDCPRDGCDGSVRVSFEVQPGEEAVPYLPGGGGHPGTPDYALAFAVADQTCDCDLDDSDLEAIEQAEQTSLLEAVDAEDAEDEAAWLRGQA
jgi:hypothetical protein